MDGNVRSALDGACRRLDGFCARKPSRSSSIVSFDMVMSTPDIDGSAFAVFVERVCESIVCCGYESEIVDWGVADDAVYVDFWNPRQSGFAVFRVMFRVEVGQLGYGFPGDVFYGDCLFDVITANIPRFVMEFENGNFEYFGAEHAA